MPEIGSKVEKMDVDMIDETFDISQSENYHLSIQIEHNMLSFCILNTVINKYIVLRSYSFSKNNLQKPVGEYATTGNKYRQVFEKDDLLGLRYKSSSHLWVSPRCTLVPENLFDKNEAETYLLFNHRAMEGEQILQSHIRSANLYNVFSYPKSLTELLKLYQPNIQLFHQATPFIESIIGGHSSGKTVMAVYFYSGYIDLVVANNNKLLFYNSFPINTIEDSVYYLSVVANMLEIELPSTKLMYLGTDKQVIAILDEYVKNIVGSEPPDAVTYSHYISEPLRRDFVNLFNLYGCE